MIKYGIENTKIHIVRGVDIEVFKLIELSTFYKQNSL